MKIPARYRPIKNAVIVFALFGFALPWVIMTIDFTWQAGRPSQQFTDFIDTVSIIANWPSILIGFHKWGDPTYFRIEALLNAIGWGLVGLVVGLLVVVSKAKRKNRNET